MVVEIYRCGASEEIALLPLRPKSSHEESLVHRSWRSAIPFGQHPSAVSIPSAGPVLGQFPNVLHHQLPGIWYYTARCNSKESRNGGKRRGGHGLEESTGRGRRRRPRRCGESCTLTMQALYRIQSRKVTRVRENPYQGNSRRVETKHVTG